MNEETIKNIITLGSLFLGIISSITAIFWSKKEKDAKNAAISSLEKQIQFYEKVTAKTLQENLEVLAKKTDELNQKLHVTELKLKIKEETMNDDEKQIATIMGRSKLIFDITDSELLIRHLSSFIKDNHIVDYGDKTIDIYDFYLKALKLIIRNKSSSDLIVEELNEWLLDYLFDPLIICMKFSSLKVRAKYYYDMLINSMIDKKILENEISIYKKILDIALKDGVDLSKGLRSDVFSRLSIKLMRTNINE